MALIKCPECGREKVSDSAEACPDCGYGIKAHFEKLKKEEEQKEQQRKAEEARKRAEVEAKKREEERIKSVPQLERPQLKAPIVTLVISVLCFFYGVVQLNESEWEVKRSIADGFGDPHFYGGLFVVIGIGLVCFGVYLFFCRIETYKLSKTNLEEYQRQVIREQDAALAVAQAQAEARERAEAEAEAMKPECPYCHSHDTEKITTIAKAINTAMLGVLGEKRKYQWHCNKCESDF